MGCYDHRKEYTALLKKELSKYMKLDDESMEVQITKKGNSKKGMKSPFLYVNIPIIDLNSYFYKG